MIRIKALVHAGVGIWLAARGLHQGKFGISQSTSSAGRAYSLLSSFVRCVRCSRIVAADRESWPSLLRAGCAVGGLLAVCSADVGTQCVPGACA